MFQSLQAAAPSSETSPSPSTMSPQLTISTEGNSVTITLKASSNDQKTAWTQLGESPEAKSFLSELLGNIALAWTRGLAHPVARQRWLYESKQLARQSDSGIKDLERDYPNLLAHWRDVFAALGPAAWNHVRGEGTVPYQTRLHTPLWFQYMPSSIC